MKQESDMLKIYLQKAQDNVTMLLEEKRKLLEKVRGLQVCTVGSPVMDRSETNWFFLPLSRIIFMNAGGVQRAKSKEWR